MGYWSQETSRSGRLAFAFLAVVLLGACRETREAPAVEPAAEAGPWILGSRVLPPPAAASDDLREAIAKTPQPEVAEHIERAPTTDEEWIEAAEEGVVAGAESAAALAESWGASVELIEIAGVTVRTVTPSEIDPANIDRLFVHTHGGAYVFGAGAAGTFEAVLIAHYAKIPVASIDYRMPPADPFPAAVDDVVAVWQSLLTERPATSMALGGTSAGGGLALASTQRFLELGLDTSGALWAGTPWADLTMTGDSQFTNEGIDRVLVSYKGILEGAAKLYADGRDLKTPLISPVHGDFDGFPPSQLVTGTRDLFLSDVIRVHRKMRVAGVLADLNVYEGLSHADYAFVMDSPEMKQVYGELGEFLRRHLRP